MSKSCAADLNTGYEQKTRTPYLIMLSLHSRRPGQSREATKGSGIAKRDTTGLPLLPCQNFKLSKNCHGSHGGNEKRDRNF
ncbi:hypothetical protein DPMN_149414 [Dreissena polymorpha]|uniref:Uncharacterized protein n=1 Tax=Dreissena polymorpha TaxID=45954 RepID=A0A9D4J4X4_DREPO|nr:hypothetical protein DPMN_149389 [Dreissena polymorpha]KAH3795852.1 hypothetical protein DPMN_149414 [Dreissena polymorpha]